MEADVPAIKTAAASAEGAEVPEVTTAAAPAKGGRCTSNDKFSLLVHMPPP